MELNEMINIVKSKLSEKRAYHSEGVMERCEELAKKFGADIETAKKIGILHDIAKEMGEEEKIKYCKKNNIKIDDIERKNIGLLHAKIGADIAKKQFEFNESMCNAIKAHTTGLANMDIYAKILFIADRTSKERNLPDIDYINELVEKDIDQAILYIMDKKIELQLLKKNLIHPDGIMARNNLLEKLSK